MYKSFKSAFFLGVVFSFTPIINGCVTTKPDIQWTKLTIVQDETTQNDIIKVLGQPLSFNDSYMDYDTDDYRHLSIDLEYIENDGDIFKYRIHPNLKNDFLRINLNYENDTVRRISIS